MGNKNILGIGCGALFVIVWVGGWTAGTLVFDVMLFRSAYRQWQAQSYPSVIGAVTHSEVKESSDSDGTTYSPDVRYVYTVDGREHHGDQYRYGQMGSSDRNAHDIVASLPKGKEVPVYYNPADPADAVLKTGIEGCDLFLALFLTPFNIVMLGAWYVVGRKVYVRMVKPAAGGARIVRRGFRQHVYETGRGILVGVAAGVLLGTSFVSIFIVGFGFGFNPPMPVILTVWTVVLLATLGITISVAARGGLEKERLVIDEAERTITVPGRGRRKKPLTVHFSDVVDVKVDERHKRDSEGDRTTVYVPTIVYTREDGSQRRLKLGREDDQAEAEGMAAWIEEQVGKGPWR